MTVAPNAQKLINKYIQNKSAFIKSSTDMLLQLQRSQGNPMGINAVGAQNLAMMLMNMFSRFYAKQPSNVKGDCRKIKAILLEKLAQMEQQIKENGAQNAGDPTDADIVAEIIKIKEEIMKLNCDIVDPTGKPYDPEAPVA